MYRKAITSVTLLLCMVLAGCSIQETREYPDRAHYGLKGNVKSIKATFNISGTDSPGYVLDFDEKGLCSRHRHDGIWKNETINAEIERNSNRQITAYKAKNADNESKVEIKYIYDKNGRVSKANTMWYGEFVVTEKYIYDGNGQVGQIERNIIDYDFPAKETTHYRYLDFDSAGNWTRREGLEMTYKILDGEETVVSENIYVEKREIEYF